MQETGGDPMGVKQIEPGKWLLSFGEGGRGTPYHRKTFYGTYFEAVEKYNYFLRLVGKASKTDHTFKNLADEYSKFCQKQKAYDKKKSVIEALKKEFGGHLLFTFNVLLVEQYQTKLLTAGKAQATVNNHIATLKHMFTKAKQWGLVTEAINKAVHEVKIVNPENRRLRYLSREEANRLLASCDAHWSLNHLKPIIQVALNTGMRKGEILSLTWDRVDMKAGLIFLEQKHTKNKERREVPLNKTAKEALSSIVRRLDVPYVFHENGKRYGQVHKSFVAACKKAKIHDFHFHDLRHTFASWLVMAGVDLTTVKELMGHKTLMMTLRYAHLAPSHKQSAVMTLDLPSAPVCSEFQR